MAHKTFRTIVKSRRRIVLPKGFEEGDEVKITVELVNTTNDEVVRTVKQSVNNQQQNYQYKPCRVCGVAVDTHSTKCSYISKEGKRLWAHDFCKKGSPSEKSK